MHLEPKGSTYTATFEEFATAQPLPLTDLVIHPGDGAMYFAVGGRRVQSGLYRVTYTGKESTEPAKPNLTGEEMRDKRRSLEAFTHDWAAEATKTQLDVIWESLGSDDRGIRHAARVALEKQPVANWKKRLSTESNPTIATAAFIALARTDGKNSAADILTMVQKFDYKSFKSQQLRLDVLRSITLALTRGGQPSDDVKKTLIPWLDTIYPARTPEENRDLSAIMAILEAPSAVEKGMELLSSASGQEEQIGYALNLRHLKQGWTPELRKTYFEWFVLAGSYQGGARFRNYLNDIKKHAVAAIPKKDMTPALTKLIKTPPKDSGPQFTLEPRNFVKMWTMKDLTPLLGAGLEGNRDFQNGRKMFGAGTCYVCHRFKNEGGAVGPDLTAVGGKFSPHDLLESIIDPGKEISDQYGASIFTLKDGKQITGRIMNMRDDEYWVNTDMMKPSENTKVNAADIKSIEPSPISMMPPALLSTMTDDNILDLLAYLISAGDPEHELFKN
ncbi:MAG: c-type cytochrome [Verrucomicrobiales bacterium]|nr:c-type cytochrome [Verrucomicrobiales bacterium]